MIIGIGLRYWQDSHNANDRNTSNIAACLFKCAVPSIVDLVNIQRVCVEGKWLALRFLRKSRVYSSTRKTVCPGYTLSSFFSKIKTFYDILKFRNLSVFRIQFISSQLNPHLAMISSHSGFSVHRFCIFLFSHLQAICPVQALLLGLKSLWTMTLFIV